MPTATITAPLKSELRRTHYNPRGKPAKRSQIIAMQRVLFEKVLDPDIEPHKAAQCACAYEKLEERLRIMSGIGAPKPVEARNEPRAKVRKPIEPQELP